MYEISFTCTIVMSFRFHGTEIWSFENFCFFVGVPYNSDSAEVFASHNKRKFEVRETSPILINELSSFVVSLLSWRIIFKIKFNVGHAPTRPSLSLVHTVVNCGPSAQLHPQHLSMVTWDNGYMLWRALWNVGTTFGLCGFCRISRNLANCTCI